MQTLWLLLERITDGRKGNHKMQPSRDLDALIADKILGLPVEQNIYGDWIWTVNRTSIPQNEYYLDMKGSYDELPHYSTNITYAFQVIIKLRENPNIYVELGAYNEKDYGETGFECRIGYGTNESSYVAFANTAPMAICLAALKMIETSSPPNP